jgi:hypothetical protein
MTDSKDYRLYLEEKFGGLNKHMNAQFEAVHDRLERIEEQTTRTNGRVNDLEDDVGTLKEKLVLHPIECSKAKDIEALKDDLIEYKFFKAHPTWTIIIIAFFVVTLVISSYGTFSTMRDNFKNKELRRDVQEIKENTK